MSMLSLQVDGLREMAVKLGVNGVCTGDLSELCVMLREAADTIESMRDRLQAAELGSGTCEFNVVEEFIPGKRQRANICECSNCGYRCAYGFIVDERFKRCPNCGARVRKKVDE